MQRREFLMRTMIGAGLATRGYTVTSAPAAPASAATPFTPVTGPDHPLAPRKTLVYGIGQTGSKILSDSVDEFIGDYWMMWVAIPDGTPEGDVQKWGTDIHPFSERNMSRLCLLARLGDSGADLLPRIAAPWQGLVPVALLLLTPKDDASDDTRLRAARQMESLRGFPDHVLLGNSEDGAQRYLDIRSGWIPPGDA